MFKCRECGKEFSDWHALGGHMRTHRPRKEKSVALPADEEQRKEVLGRALGRLSELSPQEAWQIVVNWIMDVYRQEQHRDEIIQTYRLRAQEGEARIDAIQGELKKLQQMVLEGHANKGMDSQL